SHGPGMIEPLLTLVAERHSQFNDTLYQLEPDIKQAPGGLRDVGVIRHLRAMAPDAFTNGRDADAERVAAAEDFLLRIRSILHLLSGRDVNLLTHDLQEKAAETIGSRKCTIVACAIVCFRKLPRFTAASSAIPIISTPSPSTRCSPFEASSHCSIRPQRAGGDSVRFCRNCTRRSC